MALGKALKFIKQVKTDDLFRVKCYEADSKKDLMHQMDFNEMEFEDAVVMNLVKCATQEEADHIQQIKLWFSLF